MALTRLERPFLSANSKAYRITRLTPFLVNQPSWTAVSSWVPALSTAPFPQYSPSEFSLMTTKSISSDEVTFSGESRPARSLMGLRLMYWSKPCLMGSSSPLIDTWSGTPGEPTAPSSIASHWERISRPS
ncbi:MAG: hypothetical protein BWX71_01379 [Deltaproteobacteria bacterium ADurb.Bin072]|nr:MAG: hypothetical protein BWX71_01379 [Deltaproteobacteria bacterium ADurb.Bin072]